MPNKKNIKEFKPQSVFPYRRAKAEQSARSRFPLPRYSSPLPGLTQRQMRSLMGKKITNAVQSRENLTRKYLQLPKNTANAAKRRGAAREVYYLYALPADIIRKINRLT